MPFFTFFTRHTDASAAATEKERNTSEIAADSERKSGAGATLVSDKDVVEQQVVLIEKTTSASSDESDSDSDSALETPPGVPVASSLEPALPGTAPSAEQDPLEPASPSSIPSLSQLAAMLDAPLERKDQRAYEIARQRNLKPADREKAREQKLKLKQAAAFARAAKAQAQAQTQATTPASDVEAVRSGNRRRGNASERSGAGDDGDDAKNVKAMTTSPRKDSESGTGVRKGHEVKMEDLLRTAKIRKPRKAGDFELIPHVRSVVVLDDRDYDTPEVEEAWEHVSGIEGKAKSYAQVVSTNKA